jgi:hypothetical protein
MTCPEDRDRAAATIEAQNLEEARRAIAVGCRLFLKRLDRLEAGLENVRTARDAGRFALATSMYLLASLPLKPETCPFCVQNVGGNRCEGCGYAETHGGRCDAETSAFGQLIEAVYDLAGEIHEIREDPPFASLDPDEGRERLENSIRRSREAAEALLAEISEAGVSELMVAKGDYIEQILGALPMDFIASPEVERSLEDVRAKLKRYW